MIRKTIHHHRTTRVFSYVHLASVFLPFASRSQEIIPVSDLIRDDNVSLIAEMKSICGAKKYETEKKEILSLLETGGTVAEFDNIIRQIKAKGLKNKDICDWKGKGKPLSYIALSQGRWEIVAYYVKHMGEEYKNTKIVIKMLKEAHRIKKLPDNSQRVSIYEMFPNKEALNRAALNLGVSWSPVEEFNPDRIFINNTTTREVEMKSTMANSRLYCIGEPSSSKAPNSSGSVNFPSSHSHDVKIITYKAYPNKPFSIPSNQFPRGGSSSSADVGVKDGPDIKLTIYEAYQKEPISIPSNQFLCGGSSSSADVMGKNGPDIGLTFYKSFRGGSSSSADVMGKNGPDIKSNCRSAFEQLPKCRLGKKLTLKMVAEVANCGLVP